MKLAAVAMSLLFVAGCSAAATPAAVTSAMVANTGCGAQALDAGSAGTLMVQVVDDQGQVQPGAAVQVIGPNEHYKLQCLPGANAAAGKDGVAHLERIMVGNYRVSAYVASGAKTMGAEAFASVEAGKATTIKVTLKAL